MLASHNLSFLFPSTATRELFPRRLQRQRGRNRTGKQTKDNAMGRKVFNLYTELSKNNYEVAMRFNYFIVASTELRFRIVTPRLWTKPKVSLSENYLSLQGKKSELLNNFLK